MFDLSFSKCKWEINVKMRQRIGNQYIVITVLLSSLLMSFIDGFIKPPYFYKSIFKIILFLMIPMIYFIINKDKINHFKRLFFPRKKDFLISLLLGISVFSIIIIAYFIFKNFIDFESIKDSLICEIGVNKDNFIGTAIYISFVNSLLEEFFFRGFAFIILKEEINTKSAYIFSAGLFAIYHVGMTSGWFNPILYLLSLLGLFIGGCLFNYLNDKCKSIYPSWLVHMSANFAINTIGCILFGII